ncbi:hypothetical protein KCU98_g1090, partial [Aureobasidium melanogenum]
MDAYFQSPMAWTNSEAALNSDLTWNNEWNFVSSLNIPTNTYSFSPYQYNQLYPSNTNYLFNQAEPITSLPDQHSLNKTSPYASDRRDSCYNLTDVWTTSDITNAGYSADAAVAHPTTTTTTMQGIYAASPSPTSQSFPSDHSFWNVQSPSSDQNRLHRKLVQHQRQVEHVTTMAATDEFFPPAAIFSVTNENQDVKDLGIAINAFGYKETTSQLREKG